jgi:hypothetical protein
MPVLPKYRGNAGLIGTVTLGRMQGEYIFRIEGYGSCSRSAGHVCNSTAVFIVSRVFYRFLVAIRRSAPILCCGIISLALDVVLSIVCMRWYGVAGIALATSLWTASACAFLGCWAYRLLPAPDVRDAEHAEA